MPTLKFATSNDLKFLTASKVCREHNVMLEQATLDLLEIQSSDGAEIARHKAAAAFAVLQCPLVVGDDTWSVSGLGGFPGPYMKDVNQWFTPDDFLRLTRDLKDRRITLRQEVVYQDATLQMAFAVNMPCRLLKEIRGKSKYAHLTITSLDGQMSLAETIAADGAGLPETRIVWDELCEWLNSRSNRQ